MLKVKFINLQSPTVFSSLFEDRSVLMCSDKCFLIIGLKCSWSWIFRKCFWPNVGNCFVPIETTPLRCKINRTLNVNKTKYLAFL